MVTAYPEIARAAFEAGAGLGAGMTDDGTTVLGADGLALPEQAQETQTRGVTNRTASRERIVCPFSSHRCSNHRALQGPGCRILLARVSPVNITRDFVIATCLTAVEED